MLSWLKPSSTSSPAETVAPVPAPAAQEVSPAVTLSPPTAPSTSASPPQPQPTSPSLSPPRPSRKEVNPNAPYVILACAGTAVGVGVLIGLRRVRQLQAKTVELSAAAAAAEAAEANAAGGGAKAAGSIVSGARPGRTSSILTKGSLAGVRTTPSQAASGNPFKAVAAAVKGPEDALSGGPSSKPLSTATASLLRKPASAPSPTPTAAPTRQPLFPPSSARAPPTATASSPSGPAAPMGSTGAPAAGSATPAAPKATLRSLIKEGRKKDADEAEELPPMTTAVMLRAAAAFGMATGLAVLLVGGPFAAACWWLGVEEPADFTPMFRRKIVTIFPSLEEGLLREEAEAAAAAAAAAASPDAPSSSAKISFADYLPAALRHSPTDGEPVTEAAPSSYIPSILHQGAAPEGEEEHGVYAWFEGVKDEFEKDRLAEVRRRAEDDKFYREWEAKQRKESQ